MIHFIIPEAFKRISSILKINSTGSFSVSGDYISQYCTNNGNITIPAKYTDVTINADFLFFIQFIKNPEASFVAYAGACLLSNLIFCYNL